MKHLKKMLFSIYLGRCAFGIDTDLQNNPDNIYFRKVAEFFDADAITKTFFFRYAQLFPKLGLILGRVFSISNSTLTFINKRILPLLSPTKQLHEPPIIWLINRLHTIVEQRQQTSNSRVDVLQLMLQVATKEKINVSKFFCASELSLGSYSFRIVQCFG